MAGRAYQPAPAPSLRGFQRRGGSAGVNYRDAPNRSARIRQEFPAGDILDFKGWIRGENVSDNDVWFVGRYTGGYSWSGSFDDTGTHDLDDLNPKPEPTPAPQPGYDIRDTGSYRVGDAVRAPPHQRIVYRRRLSDTSAEGATIGGDL